jgi:hypothetical protein
VTELSQGGDFSEHVSRSDKKLSEIPQLMPIEEIIRQGFRETYGDIGSEIDFSQINIVPREKLKNEQIRDNSEIFSQEIEDIGCSLGVNLKHGSPECRLLTLSATTGEILIEEEYIKERLAEMHSIDKDIKANAYMGFIRDITHEFVHSIGGIKEITDSEQVQELTEFVLNRSADMLAHQMLSIGGDVSDKARTQMLERGKKILGSTEKKVVIQGGSIYIFDNEGRVLLSTGYNLNEEIVESITEASLISSFDIVLKKIGFNLSSKQVLAAYKGARENGTLEGNKSKLGPDAVLPIQASVALEAAKLYNPKRIMHAHINGNIVELLMKYNQSDIIR